MEMTYEEYCTKRQEEINKLPLMFAFSEEQFNEGMKKLGLKPTDTDKVYKLGGTGGFYRKEDAEQVRACLCKNELPELMKDHEFAEGAFYYEMCNHEYGINWEGDWDVCSCFGDCEYGEDKSGVDYLREMGYGEDVCKAYQNAKRKYNKMAIENDWF